ncbi:MAG: UDP-glucose 4-epimerase, partial [Acidimicrobiales bacterium]|nr:UDP-glucose 4-epimerase [Acidimicrobiales bacterium]
AGAPGVGDGFVCNIGTGLETSVNELYAAMAMAAGVSADAVHAPARAGELARSCLDPTLAGKVLDWTPETDLATGVAATLAWFAERDA